MTPVKIITGHTCSGKTARAIDEALACGAEIISCDSVQIYRGMDIGSAKPTQTEMRGVPHHLFDVAPPSEKFDVAKYAEQAKRAVCDILKRGKKIIVCGGSGFYLSAWFRAVTDNVEIPAAIAKKADQIEAMRGAAGLAEALLECDRTAPRFVDMQNPRRTKNALRRCLASGKTVGELLDDFKKLPPPIGNFDITLEILDLPDAVLLPKIAARTKQMIVRGLVEETRKLLDLGIEKNPSAALAIGYRQTIEWIKSGAHNTESLADEISRQTFMLVKKQRKYFRNNLI